MAERVIHSGDHLTRELEEHSTSAAELARCHNIPASEIGFILNGRSALTMETAIGFPCLQRVRASGSIFRTVTISREEIVDGVVAEGDIADHRVEEVIGEQGLLEAFGEDRRVGVEKLGDPL